MGWRLCDTAHPSRPIVCRCRWPYAYQRQTALPCSYREVSVDRNTATETQTLKEAHGGTEPGRGPGHTREPDVQALSVGSRRSGTGGDTSEPCPGYNRTLSVPGTRVLLGPGHTAFATFPSVAWISRSAPNLRSAELPGVNGRPLGISKYRNLDSGKKCC